MSVTITTPIQPQAERAALQDLVQSDGWQVFERAMRERFSPERYEAEIRELSEKDADPVITATLMKQINATYSAMRQMLDWPRARVKELDGGSRRALAPTVSEMFWRKRRA